MAWEWSHAPEAYEKAEANLRCKSREWLAQCLAEWKCKDIEDEAKAFETLFDNMSTRMCDEGMYPSLEWPDLPQGIPESMTTDPLTDGRYDHLRRHFLTSSLWSKETLADEIWERAQEQRTCDNGGYNPWMCPHGCHKVEW